MPKSQYESAARAFSLECYNLGWTFSVRGSVVSIHKQIEKGNKESFVNADCEYSHILNLLPVTQAGSVWGTDGGGVGALTAMRTGVFTMNKSGVSKRVIAWLVK